MADVVAHRTRHANASDRADCLKPGGDIDSVTMNIGAVGKHVTDVDPDSIANEPVGR